MHVFKQRYSYDSNPLLVTDNDGSHADQAHRTSRNRRFLDNKSSRITIAIMRSEINKLMLNMTASKFCQLPNKVCLPGRRGPRGRKGRKGIMGPKGPTGKFDKQGAQGPPGKSGKQGVRGPPGSKGNNGSPGPRGPQGLPGPKGDPGSAKSMLGKAKKTVRLQVRGKSLPVDYTNSSYLSALLYINDYCIFLFFSIFFTLLLGFK